MTTPRALLRGTDASGHLNLWVTDGTAAGTSELTVAGAYSGGLLYSTSAFNPDFTVLGAEVLFDGYDASGHYDLWVTDGTSAGTEELPVAGVWSSGLFGSTLVVPDFTVLGSKALFSGYDTHGHISLWVTDGTSAGTSELTVAGASSSGLFYGGGSPLFTVLGGKALFAGVDTSLHVNLWVTDGSSAGTSELIAAGANPAGLLVDGPSNQLGLLHPAFTVAGSRVVFEGADASGRNNLWVTDGTSAGTSELTICRGQLQRAVRWGWCPHLYQRFRLKGAIQGLGC